MESLQKNILLIYSLLFNNIINYTKEENLFYIKQSSYNTYS